MAGHAQSRRRSQLHREAERRLQFTAIWIAGPPSGPVRVAVSRDPKERIRVMKLNCVHKDPEVHIRWIAGPEAANHLIQHYRRAAQRHGYHLGSDGYGLNPGYALRLVVILARELEVELLDDAGRAALIKAGVKDELARRESAAWRRRG